MNTCREKITPSCEPEDDLRIEDVKSDDEAVQPPMKVSVRCNATFKKDQQSRSDARDKLQNQIAYVDSLSQRLFLISGSQSDSQC